jgi:hypothetical protein
MMIDDTIGISQGFIRIGQPQVGSTYVAILQTISLES